MVPPFGEKEPAEGIAGDGRAVSGLRRRFEIALGAGDRCGLVAGLAVGKIEDDFAGIPRPHQRFKRLQIEHRLPFRETNNQWLRKESFPGDPGRNFACPVAFHGIGFGPPAQPVRRFLSFKSFSISKISVRNRAPGPPKFASRRLDRSTTPRAT